MNQASVTRGFQSKTTLNPQEKHRKVTKPTPEQKKHGQRYSGVLCEAAYLGGGDGGGSQRRKRGNKRFTYLTYSVVIRAYASNEVIARLQPIVGKYRDTSEDRDNKFKAIALENGVILNGQKCILEAKEDTKIVENSKKSGWGELPRPKKFTKIMRRMIRRTIAALEAKFGRKNARFITITLPGSTEAAIRMFAKKSGKFVNAFNRFLWRCVKEDFGNRVSCWEWQDRGALHLHAVVFSKNQEGLKKIDEKLRDWCYKYFLRLSEKTGVDMFERSYGGTWKNNPEVLRCDSEPITKSAAAYMSKYMSKDDSKDASKFDEDKPIYFPSSWWARGIAAKKIYHERQIELERKRIDEQSAELLTQVCRHLTALFSPEEYKEALVYKDLVGGGVNIKMIFKPENMDIVLYHLEDFMSWFDEIENHGVDTRLMDYETALEIQDNRNYLDGWMQMIREKNRNADPRTWMKQYRKNPAPLPKFSSDDQWQEFYNSNYSREISLSSTNHHRYYSCGMPVSISKK